MTEQNIKKYKHTFVDILVAVRAHLALLGPRVGRNSIQQVAVEVVAAIGLTVDTRGPGQLGWKRPRAIDARISKTNATLRQTAKEVHSLFKLLYIQVQTRLLIDRGW